MIGGGALTRSRRRRRRRAAPAGRARPGRARGAWCRGPLSQSSRRSRAQRRHQPLARLYIGRGGASGRGRGQRRAPRSIGPAALSRPLMGVAFSDGPRPLFPARCAPPLKLTRPRRGGDGATWWGPRDYVALGWDGRCIGFFSPEIPRVRFREALDVGGGARPCMPQPPSPETRTAGLTRSHRRWFETPLLLPESPKGLSLCQVEEGKGHPVPKPGHLSRARRTEATGGAVAAPREEKKKNQFLFYFIFVFERVG